jgi:pimeloyl-ACP methyl ester carboxylesterase
MTKRKIDQASSTDVPLDWSAVNPFQEYFIDAWQRSILFLDVLRQRGNIAKDHNARAVPNVLTFDAVLVMDGRTLARPVNYGLVRIVPPPGVKIDAEKRPFIVVDPRAGHGPGIGGMKHDSEIGVAMEAGHPCYFVGFLPDPVPGQTVEDVCTAEAIFIRTVADLHPDAEGKPVLIGNCQAGWQLMMMAALNPELAGPIMLAGTPLSYWAGVRGKNPMRYMGGNLGGTWLTALSGDLGHGIFDGADLVKNFESMNIANTLWEKPYNVYSKVDTEAERFLEFETWWGSPVLLNAGEMQWIADNLFVGNKLTAGELLASDGTRIDLRNIRSPIIVFCSWGDDITPPQQALGWVTDLYDTDEELIANGQTIVYTLHQSIGHLGIFVSGQVATKEHEEFASAMDMIDLMPPGLYEAVITAQGEDMANPQLIGGGYLLRLEARSLDDIRALGNNDAEDARRFATAARLSEVNLGLYRNTLAPIVQSMSTTDSAEVMRKMHPARVKFSMFSDDNPMMAPVKALADTVRAQRKPVSPTNPFLTMEQAAADMISMSLKSLGAARDAMQEQMFLTTFGSPVLQALVGLGPDLEKSARKIDRDLLRAANEAQQRLRLDARFEAGGAPEAMIRALIYVTQLGQQFDERGFAVAKAIRAARPPRERLSQAQLKALVTEQFLLLKMDEVRAVKALSRLMPTDIAHRREILDELKRVASASGSPSEAVVARLAEVEALFGVPPESTAAAVELPIKAAPIAATGKR